MSNNEEGRPDFTTMRGMIWNANHVLDHALHPGGPGIPAQVVQKCKGVILMYIQEGGVVITKSSGTGVILAKNESGEWSPPSALSATSTGFGLLFGGSANDVLLFLMTDKALEEVSKKLCILNGRVEVAVTVGPVGRSVEKVAEGKSLAEHDTLMYAFSKGVFTGVGISKPVLAEQRHENHHFYGIKVTASDIISGRNKVTVPPNSGVEDLYRKLSLLGDGQTNILTDEEKKIKESRRVDSLKVKADATEK